MLKAKNRYEYWWYSTLEAICIIPTVLAILPIPLMIPICLIAMCIEQPEEMPLVIIYFVWLIIGILILLYFENDNHES